MNITTQLGAKFDTKKPAYSSIVKVLDDRGRSVMDKLKITGNMTTVSEFGRNVSMIEVEHSFGTDEVHEEFLWQHH